MKKKFILNSISGSLIVLLGGVSSLAHADLYINKVDTSSIKGQANVELHNAPYEIKPRVEEVNKKQEPLISQNNIINSNQEQTKTNNVIPKVDSNSIKEKQNINTEKYDHKNDKINDTIVENNVKISQEELSNKIKESVNVKAIEPTIVPRIEKSAVLMDKGFLSNSLRQELQKKGWSLEWASGSDRSIDVSYTLTYKDVTDLVTQVSKLYNMKIDVYTINKTIYVQD